MNVSMGCRRCSYAAGTNGHLCNCQGTFNVSFLSESLVGWMDGRLLEGAKAGFDDL